jgi:hypothetical protein
MDPAAELLSSVLWFAMEGSSRIKTPIDISGAQRPPPSGVVPNLGRNAPTGDIIPLHALQHRRILSDSMVWNFIDVVLNIRKQKQHDQALDMNISL